MNDPVITLNTERNRFETTQDGHTAYLSFVRLPDGNLAYEHTIVPSELGGRGLGGKLARQTGAARAGLGGGAGREGAPGLLLRQSLH